MKFLYVDVKDRKLVAVFQNNKGEKSILGPCRSTRTKIKARTIIKSQNDSALRRRTTGLRYRKEKQETLLEILVKTI